MRRHLVSVFSVGVLALASACVPTTSYKPPPPQTERLSTTPPIGVAPPPQMEQRIDPPKVFTQRIPPGAETVRIGLLLPLTGESRALGQSMLDAATLALYDYYLPLKPQEITANVVLIPKDTGISSASAMNAARQALLQDVNLMLGPLYSTAASAIAPITRNQNVPLITFSNNRNVAGEDVYVFGFMPEQQVTRIADYIATKDVSSIAAILPNDAYGQTVAETLKKTLSRRGIRVSPVEFYAKTELNMEAAVTRLKQGYTNQPFEALFIAEGGVFLKKLVLSLSSQGLTSNTVRYVGTGLWDDKDVHAMPGMEGAWYTSSPPDHYERFEKRFEAVYGYRPERLASLAYDSVTLAAALALHGDGANYDDFTLTSPQGFIGPANSLYRLMPNGITERGLMVMEITGGKTRTLDAAPSQFE